MTAEVTGSTTDTAYCGRPPVPGDLFERWNLDPAGITLLTALAVLYWFGAWRRRVWARPEVDAFGAGWSLLAVSIVSPLCALAIALFSARMAQHLLIVLVAAPLLVRGRIDAVLASIVRRRIAAPSRSSAPATGLAFAAFWWLWHAPTIYAVALRNDAVYAAMQITLTTTSFLVWRILLRETSFGALALGIGTAIQMGLLGALLTFAPDPLYAAHFGTTTPFGFTPLEDQQLAGLLCWVPGCGVLVAAGLVTALRWVSPAPPRAPR